MSDIVVIIHKEWADMIRNRIVFSMLVLVPLIMTTIPVAMLSVAGSAAAAPSDLDQLRPMLASNPVFAGMDPQEALQAALGSNMLILFLLMPLIVPITISAYSIVGEKLTRSLEPLLATPISTQQLMCGKSLAAALPGIGMTWLGYAVFLLAARLFAVSDRVFDVFVDPMWLVAMFVLVPLLTIMADEVGIIVSSRVNDPRAAQQLAALVVLPVIVLFLGALLGCILLNALTFLAAAAVVAMADVGLVYLGTALFQRETILTRWR